MALKLIGRLNNKIIFIMGVSGVGKSTIGNLLAQALKIPFFDGDAYHPQINIDKMSRGEALNDEDRQGWLEKINLLAQGELKKSGCVIACSALKERYRRILSLNLDSQLYWVYLNGSFEQIKNRIDSRGAHFMSSDLLSSQFDILEEPQKALKIDVSLSPEEIVKMIETEICDKSAFGLFGLGVMGKSLSRNLASRGFKMSLFNRHLAGKEEDVALNFKNEFEELSSSKAFDNVQAFVSSLETPRKIMLMVNAGKTVDLVIEDLLPFLESGDILIDGGNSNYLKTKQRNDYLKSKNIHFVGTGVSGGEEGALTGPSIMPGCEKEVYGHIKPFLEAIAAKDIDGLACCSHIGPEGSGHFVKMIHNGIEYVEMQLLAEVYSILKAKGNNPDQMATILEGWKRSANSYLLEITIDILRKKEGEDWLLHKIMDKAGNKGTGNWTAISSAQLGIPSTMVVSALFARYASYFKDERIQASKSFESKPEFQCNLNEEEILEAYQFARIVNHYQGFRLIQEASRQYDWALNLSELARIWTNGCIIRSDFMIELVSVFKTTNNLLSHESINQKLTALKPSVKKVVAESILNEVAIPNLSESINFLNGFTKAISSANLIQAQRDYFGAHTYQRLNDESEKFYHTEWKKA